MQCVKCQKKLGADEKFCSNCGAENTRPLDESTPKKIDGWLSFFLFGLFVSVIWNVMAGFSELSSTYTDGELTTNLKHFIALVLVLYYGGITALNVYALHAMVKFKNNAVTLTKAFLATVFTMNIVNTLPFLISGQAIPGGEDPITGNNALLRSLFYCVAFFLYLTLSEKVKSLFPTEKRETSTLDKVLLGSLFTLVGCVSLLAFFGNLDTSNEQTSSADNTQQNQTNEKRAWQTFSPTDESFSVRLPVTPVYTVEDIPVPGSELVLKNHSYVSEASENEVYFVNIMSYPKDLPISDPAEILSETLKGMVSSDENNTLTISEKSVYKTYDALDYVIDNKTEKAVLKGKVFIVGNKLFQLMQATSIDITALNEYAVFTQSFTPSSQ